MSPSEAPGVDRDIYPMPMFVTFQVSDLLAATRWYEEVGFVVLATMPGPAGPDSLVHLRRLRYQDLLLVTGDPVPGVQISLAAGDDDLAARAERVNRYIAEAGAWCRVDGPRDTPWFTRDLTAVDADGYAVTLTSPRTADIAAASDWSQTVAQSVGRRPGSDP